jgi:HD domain
MNSPQMYSDPPRGGLVAGFCEVVAAARPQADVDLIGRACDVAARCHQGQTRYSGDPYITHPVAVATILARLEEIDWVDDQTLCAALLHDVVADTPYTLAALRRDFGAGIAAMVAEHMALDLLDGQQTRQLTQVLASLGSADTRVVAVKVADRLHNMQTLQFVSQAKQVRKAREVLDTFLPVAQQLSMPTVRSQLQALALAALVRNRPAYLPHRRVIVALDIERSTARPDPVKADLRTMLYELFDAALRSAGVQASCRGPFIDRGDGLLALIDPAGQARVLNHAVPAFSQLLAGYNASLTDRDRQQRQLRVRAVMHAGNVNDDDNGCFGQALDIAFRLLDSPRVKTALQTAHGPLAFVISADVYNWALHNGPWVISRTAFKHRFTVQVAGKQHQGWIQLAPAAASGSLSL